MYILRVKHIPSAAIVIIAASLSFSCEKVDTQVQAAENVQLGQELHLLRKENDAAFLAKAFDNVLLESQLAELAVRRAVSPEVKEFAISVLTDHSIAMNELREIASRINIELPLEMSPEHRKHFVRIAAKSGVQFDRAFCDFMYLNATVALKKFERIAQDGSSEDLKDWAWGKLGVLKRHIALAQDIETGTRKATAVNSLTR